MRPGKELLLLNEYYDVCGSDASAIFVEPFSQQYPNINVQLFDAASVDTDERYDGIFSNKVLYPLTQDAPRVSFEHQARDLNTGGIALHSF